LLTWIWMDDGVRILALKKPQLDKPCLNVYLSAIFKSLVAHRLLQETIPPTAELATGKK
jgi:hypothetical protein